MYWNFLSMQKYSRGFWTTFIIVSAIFLTGWFVFWEVKNQGLDSLRSLLGLMPISEEVRSDLDTVVTLANALLDTDGEERVYMVLFQNNMELRPGGGFIGSFGIVRIRDGAVTDFAVHDTGNFDGRIPDTVDPPYPMRDTLRINSWKLRDSNYAPDFPENAHWAEKFYHMGQGGESFDGIVAITTNVLTSFLEVTGPVQISGYPGEYGAENAILDLEYQVEQGYRDQNIDFGERKSMMNLLGDEILNRVKALPLGKKYELFKVVLDDLHRKDIQIWLKDEELQSHVAAAGWDGVMDDRWIDDYLFAVDANLGAFKSDYYVKRLFAYTVDLTQPKPKATLAVTYRHTAPTRDWFTKDYQSFLRVYVPKGSFLDRVTNAAMDPVYGEYLNKKYFGVLVQVKLGSEKTVTFEYALPESLENEWYDLKIQKQAGLNDVPMHVTVIKKDGTREEKNFVLNRDTILSELKN